MLNLRPIMVAKLGSKPKISSILSRFILNKFSSSPSTPTVNIKRRLSIKNAPLERQKSIVIIGVHGWAPRFISNLEDGPSAEFCQSMENVIRQKLNLKSTDKAKFTKIPLLGYGQVLDRVENFMKQIEENKEWVTSLKQANVVFILGHSQGVPVSTILLSRLIEKKILEPAKQRVCTLFMAGINQGPTHKIEMKKEFGNLLKDKSQSELFEFQDSSTQLFMTFRQCAMKVLKAGVKAVYVASAYDEVVPLHSALFSHIDHPSILRAVYVNDETYDQKEFLCYLIQILVRLRNHGASDQGLLAHLSDVMIGCFANCGHSDLHDQDEVFELAVDYLYFSKPTPEKEASFVDFHFTNISTLGYIPWAMRGLLDQTALGSVTLSKDLNKLKELFLQWKPSLINKEACALKTVLAPFGDIQEIVYLKKSFFPAIKKTVSI
ncbi:hypothetical protein G9A89_002490 [Geosiphon pyriformis]|nr:hypothetical protein G9A89_002490 [Geosiphon pyriformis]